MQVEERPSVEELRDLKARLLRLIADRGESNPERTRIGCIIDKLFAAYERNDEGYDWKDFWTQCWNEPLDVLRIGRGANYGPLDQVKSRIYTVRAKFKRYFSKDGKDEPWRAEIVGSPYRLRVFSNTEVERRSLERSPLGSTTTIGLICALRSNWFNSELIAGAEKAARRLGYSAVVAYSDGDLYEEERLLHGFHEQCAGLIVVPILDEDSREQHELLKPFVDLVKQKYPLVFVDRRVPDCEAPLVGCDNDRGAWLATDYLVAKCGCTRVIVVAESGSSAAKERVLAHEDYMRKKFGRNIEAEVYWPNSPEELGGYEFMQTFLSGPMGDELRTQLASGKNVGLFATNDAIIRGIRAFLDRSPKDLLPAPLPMVGFDGRDFTRFMSPPLVTIKQDFYEIGEKAVQVLVELIDRKNDKSAVAPPSSSGALSKTTSVRLIDTDDVWPSR